MVSTAEEYALEIEIFTLRRGLGLKFCVATRKYGVFSSKHMDSLEGLTFSTKSAKSVHSRLATAVQWTLFIPKVNQLDGRARVA